MNYQKRRAESVKTCFVRNGKIDANEYNGCKGDRVDKRLMATVTESQVEEL